MNLAADRELWMCFYTEFPIVRVTDDGYRAWEYGASAGSMAVTPTRVLMVGDYEDPNRAKTVELLDDGTTTVKATGTIVRADGGAMDKMQYEGIGDALYGVRGAEVFKLDSW
jgi:hypothetical protein